MRTVKRVSRQLNKTKWEQLESLVAAYAREKQVHLDYYLQDDNFVHHASDRVRRDELVKADYRSTFGLQGRSWKLALKDAHETVVKWWAALAEAVRGRIYKLKWTEAQRHYAYWLLVSEQRFAQLILKTAPVNKAIKLKLTERKQVTGYLRRTVRKLRGQYPQVGVARSVALDANMYTVQQGKRQVIEVAGLHAGKRITIPLLGQTSFAGNLRLVLHPETRHVTVHVGFSITATPLTGEVAAVDAGITEVFTDELGNAYGTELKDKLVQASDYLCDKGRKRNKLHSVRQKALERGDYAKAARILKNNLGTVKQKAVKRKFTAGMSTLINHAINQLVDTRQMRELVTEKLDIRGKAKSKQISRRVSLWTRAILNERIAFKASAKGFSRNEVNPAYSSQLCPVCGYLDRSNRRGDAFQCQVCGHACQSDRVAALNLKARANDPEICRWTPPAEVKAILTRRYEARLEHRSPSPAQADEMKTTNVTVTGPTLDTESTMRVQTYRRAATARLGGRKAVLPVRPSKRETVVGNQAKPTTQKTG